MLQPINPAFNVAVLRMAELTCPRGWTARANAPSSLAELRRVTDRERIMVVSDQNCADTIFGDPEINIAFRAWHDACHLLGDHPFTRDGERAVCRDQIAQLRKVFGVNPVFERLLRSEVIGQADYFDEWGVFPKDQRKFTSEYLRCHVAAIMSREPGFYWLPATST